MHTHQTVHDILQSHWESDMPDKLLDALRPFDGKNVTTRILDKLPGGKDQWVLERAYGMTHLKSREYWHSQGHKGISLLLYYGENSQPLDLKWMQEHNAAYYSARVERNHKRMEAMNTKADLDAMANALNRVQRAIAELEAAKAELFKLTEYGEKFSPDSFAFEDACGLRVTDSRGNTKRGYEGK